MGKRTMVAAPATLEWDRGALEAECDRAAIVQAGVEAYLGRAVFVAGGQLVVRVSLSRVEEGGASHVVAKVNQRDDSGKAWGERTVSGDATCASLDDPLTLVVALMVDSPTPPEEAETPEPSPSPAPPPEPPEPSPEAEETSEIQTAPSLERSAVAPAHAAFWGLGVVSMGALPGAALGGSLVATVKPKGFIGLGLEGAVLVPQRKPLGTGSLEVSFGSVGALVCPLQGVDGSVWYSACAGVGVARLHVKARELLEARSRTEWLAQPSLAARAAWLPGFGLMLGGGLQASFPLSADRYVYRDPAGMRRGAFELSPLVLAASVGVGWLLD